ncbi:hypothetical protein [Nostoc sp. 'Lobaria pulmonaria (5183) cyanobiont']|nr:hypothetical protein [Nostoc sp. 'Lobaria pulmonaria (5183) cyanobiont']
MKGLKVFAIAYSVGLLNYAMPTVVNYALCLLKLQMHKHTL